MLLFRTSGASRALACLIELGNASRASCGRLIGMAIAGTDTLGDATGEGDHRAAAPITFVTSESFGGTGCFEALDGLFCCKKSRSQRVDAFCGHWNDGCEAWALEKMQVC